MKKLFLIISFFPITIVSFAQKGWSVCVSPQFESRVDDIFMVNTKTGYAVCGDGQIVKTTNGGNNWISLTTDTNVYCRSVEFMNEQKGFVGGFPAQSSPVDNILRMTTDGGLTWTDLTAGLNPRVRTGGICGLAIADNNTVYGCGNWFEDSAYIIKSVDGGNSWTYISMKNQAAHLIDMHFINKDEGFATGSNTIGHAAIFHTADGGQTWSILYEQAGIYMGYCWKIQRLTDKVYFSSIESFDPMSPSKILRSDDGGMHWTTREVYPTGYNIEGIGFINTRKGWTGGDDVFSFETNDGGATWDTVHICPSMNRVFRVNDTLLFATGRKIWKYVSDGISPYAPDTARFAWVYCYPNPVKGNLNVDIYIENNTQVFISLFDESGRRVRTIENTFKIKGVYKYYLNTTNFSNGIYYIILKTHDDKTAQKIVIAN